MQGGESHGALGPWEHVCKCSKFAFGDRSYRYGRQLTASRFFRLFLQRQPGLIHLSIARLLALAPC